MNDLPMDIRHEILETLGDAPFLLYQFYKTKLPTRELIDSDSVMDYFHWSYLKTYRTKQKLINSGWFKKERTISSKGNTIITYTLIQSSKFKKRLPFVTTRVVLGKKRTLTRLAS